MSVRDLFVGIDVDVDDNPLRDLDSLVNEVKQAFSRLDSGGLDDIEKDVQSVANEFDDLSREIAAADKNVDQLDNNTLDSLRNDLRATSIQMDILEDDVKDLVHEEREAIVTTSLLGNAFTLTGVKGIAMSAGISGGIGLLTAILAPLILLVGGLGASLIAAGAGVVAFGTVAMGALAPVISGAENLTEAQRKARTELESFTSFWGDFAQQFETPIFEMFSLGLESARKILSLLEPTISNVADVVVTLASEFNTALGSSSSFFNWLESNAADALYNFAHIAGNAISGVWKMFEAFTPVSKLIEDGLLSLTQRFDEWASNLSSSNGFQQFLDYAMTNGPKLMDVLGSVFGILGDVIVALAPLGSLVLTGLQLLTGFIDANLGPSLSILGEYIGQIGDAFVNVLLPAIMPMVEQWLPILGQWFDNAMNLGGALVETFIAIFPTLKDIFDSVMPVVITLFENLYGIIGSLINNVVIPLLPMLATVLQEVWSVVKPILEPLKNLFSTIGDTVITLINDVVSPLLPVIGVVLSAMWKVAKPILDGIVTVFGNIIDAISDTVGAVGDIVRAFANFKVPKWVSSLGGAVKGAYGNVKDFVMGSHATGLERVPFDGYVAELHKDEAVLTAEQSNALRDLGILNGDGSSPELDLSGGSNGGNYQTTSTTNSNSSTVTAPVTIVVQGNDNPQETARSIKEELEDFFADLNIIIPTPREG